VRCLAESIAAAGRDVTRLMLQRLSGG